MIFFPDPHVGRRTERGHFGLLGVLESMSGRLVASFAKYLRVEMASLEQNEEPNAQAAVA